MQGQSPTVSFCPSFSVYSTDKLANIAAEVTETEQKDGLKQRNTAPVDLNDDDDFEFVTVKASPLAWQSFPLFNVDLLHDHPLRSHQDDYNDDVAPSSVEARLRKLFIDDRRDRRSSLSSSSSSSEADELEGKAQSGTYCVRRPKTPPSQSPSPARCQKSSSTGSSGKHRSWRFRDLLRRSRSDGKYSLSLTRLSENPSNYGNNNNSKNKSKKEAESEKKKGRSKKEHKGNRTTPAATTANDVFYGRNKALKGGEKRKSYLPYRQDLFGFCVMSMAGLS